MIEILQGIVEGSPGWIPLVLLVLVLLVFCFAVVFGVVRGRELNVLNLVRIGPRRPVGDGHPPEERGALRYQKLMYVKILHLSQMGAGKNPVYRRVVERLGGEEVPVFDEAVYYGLNIFSRQEQKYSTVFRSSGIVDLRIGHPWKEKLEFPDKDAQVLRNIVRQTVKGPSNVYLTVSHHYNGLQPGHEDIGVRMDQDTQHARLVVDFSSIPNSQLLFRERPKAVLRTGNEEKPIGIIEYSPTIFSTAQNDLKEGQVLRIDFKIDWDWLTGVAVTLESPMAEGGQIERTRAVKARHEKDLLRKANVVAVGVGFREQGGRVSDQVCIVVSVRRKVRRNQISPGDVIPREIEGVPVDVKVTGEIRALKQH